MAETWGGAVGLRDGEYLGIYVRDGCWFVVFISCDDFFFFPLISLASGLSDLLEFSKDQRLVLFFFPFFFLFCYFLLCSAYHLSSN